MDAALTLAEAAQVLDPPITERQLRVIVAALGWQPTEVRYSGRTGRPPAAYDAAELMKLHQALLPWLVTPGELRAYIGPAALCPETGERRPRVAGMVPGRGRDGCGIPPQ
jgi:hypothetical protein